MLSGQTLRATRHRSDDGIWAGDAILTAAAVDRYGLTARALRYYEERGMLAPDRDHINRRIYGLRDQLRMEWIAILRAAELPLRDVEAVLEAEDGAGAGAKIAAERLEALRTRLSIRMSLVNQILEEMQGPGVRPGQQPSDAR